MNQRECIIINEASSTQTAFFSYNSNYNINYISDRKKLSLSDCRIDDYVKNSDAEGYYNIIANNSIIKAHIINSNCTKFHWSLLATGGMRNLEDKLGSKIAKDFYSNIKEIFNKNNKLCVNEICKEIVLSEAKTITGSDEAYYAWLTIKQIKNTGCHVIIDLGGQTGQISNSTHTYSAYLGKERSIKNINADISICHNDKNQYNGAQCRALIESYLKTNFAGIMNFKFDQYCKIYAISNFYNYFHDVCDAYLPYITNNNLPVNASALTKIINLCSEKLIHNSLVFEIHDFKVITDEICQYWEDSWEGTKAFYAKDACFAGNHNYQVLKLLGMQDNHEINADSADWAPGAAINCLASN